MPDRKTCPGLRYRHLAHRQTRAGFEDSVRAVPKSRGPTGLSRMTAATARTDDAAALWTAQLFFQSPIRDPWLLMHLYLLEVDFDTVTG